MIKRDVREQQDRFENNDLEKDIFQQAQKNELLPQWQTVRLEDVATLQRGNDLPVNHRGQGFYPVVGSNGIVGYHSEFIVKGPGVLVGRSGSVGKVTWIEDDYWPLNTTLWIKDFHGNDPHFIYYFLCYLDLGKYTGGVSVPTLNRNVVHPLMVAVPPFSQQQAIARVLRGVQEAIQTRRDELNLERKLKAALMAYLFTHGTRGELTKQTELGELPESWQVVELGEIITLHRGYDLPTRDRKPGIVPIISSSGISGTHSEAKVIAPGVVTGRYGTIGEVFYIEQDFWPLNTTLYVSEFRRVTPHFVAYLLRTLNFNIFNDKSTVPGVNRNDLHRIKTVLPPPSEQQNIVDVLSTHDTKLSALEQETSLLEELFRALLEELMTGRLSTLPLIQEGETYDRAVSSATTND